MAGRPRTLGEIAQTAQTSVFAIGEVDLEHGAIGQSRAAARL